MGGYSKSDVAGLTVLDWLLQPVETTAIVDSNGNSLEDSICGNLDLVLNTHRQAELVPPEFEQCASSVLNYGIPELTSQIDLSLPAEQHKLCQAIEETIRLFEPRLRKPKVSRIERKDKGMRLRFRLEGEVEGFSGREIFELDFESNTSKMSILAGEQR